jgi:hypothetical protein
MGEHFLDIELALPVGFILLAATGLVYAAFAVYLYFRFERGAASDTTYLLPPSASFL